MLCPWLCSDFKASNSCRSFWNVVCVVDWFSISCCDSSPFQISRSHLSSLIQDLKFYQTMLKFKNRRSSNEFLSPIDYDLNTITWKLKYMPTLLYLQNACPPSCVFKAHAYPLTSSKICSPTPRLQVLFSLSLSLSDWRYCWALYCLSFPGSCNWILSKFFPSTFSFFRTIVNNLFIPCCITELL